MEHLTGRTRLRNYLPGRGAEPLLVLQVEVSVAHPENLGDRVEVERREAWRDATVKDLTSCPDLLANWSNALTK